MCPQYPPPPSTRTEFFPPCAWEVSSVTLPPWLQSGAYVGQAAWSHPLSKPSDTWATDPGRRRRPARARRAVWGNIFFFSRGKCRSLQNSQATQNQGRRGLVRFEVFKCWGFDDATQCIPASAPELLSAFAVALVLPISTLCGESCPGFSCRHPCCSHPEVPEPRSSAGSSWAKPWRGLTSGNLTGDIDTLEVSMCLSN